MTMVDDDDGDNDPHQFILFWCEDGLENAIDIDEYFRNRMALILSNGDDDDATLPDSLHDTLALLSLRARYNSHRTYELYGIGLPTGITRDEIFKMFDTNCDGMKKLVRDRGVKLPI